jgi:hypothetical protein
MGIYDENRDWQTVIRYTGTHKEMGVGFKPIAEKYLETVQGQLDQGFNLGFEKRSQYKMSDSTTLNLTIIPGPNSPIAVMEIHTSLPPPEPFVTGRPIAETKQCPQLPLGSEGRRLFTHVFGHDAKGDLGMPNTIFAQRKVPVAKTSYIVPTLDQGAYCSSQGAPFPGDGALLFHGEIRLTTPFQFMGGARQVCYLHQAWVGFEDPHVRVAFTGNITAKNAPCTVDFAGFPIFVPNVEVFRAGHSNVICATGNSGDNNSCSAFFNNDCWLVEGAAMVGTSEVEPDGQAELQGVKRGTGLSGVGEPRQFAAFTFISPGQNFRQEIEIVLLYPSDLCRAAVGIFYGGPDGLRPWKYKDWDGYEVTTANVTAGLRDWYNSPQVCDDDVFGKSNEVALNDGAYLIGAAAQGMAWVQGDDVAARLNRGAQAALNSRAFWFELDGQGYPTGNGLHGESILGGGRGFADLAFF